MMKDLKPNEPCEFLELRETGKYSRILIKFDF